MNLSEPLLSKPVPVTVGFVAFAFIVLCMICDVRFRRIPNWLSASVMGMGVVINVACFGSAGLRASLMGFLLPVGILLLPFALGGIGGGDVKMMGALGTLLGPLPALEALIIGSILGGAIMVVHLARLGRLREKLATTRKLFTAAASARSLAPLKLPTTGPNVVSLPYSVPLGLGTIAVMVVSSVVGGS